MAFSVPHGGAIAGFPDVLKNRLYPDMLYGIRRKASIGVGFLFSKGLSASGPAPSTYAVMAACSSASRWRNAGIIPRPAPINSVNAFGVYRSATPASEG